MWLSSPCSTIQLLHNSCRLSITISNPSPLCGTSVLRTRSDLPAIQGNSLTPLPVIHTATNSLPPSDNPMRLLASPSDITHNFVQVALASASLATSAILALSGSDPGPLSAPRSLAATFAPSDRRTLGSSRTLGNNNSFCPPGSRRTHIDSDSLAGCCSLSCINSCSCTARSGIDLHIDCRAIQSMIYTSSVLLLLQLRQHVGPAADWRTVDPTTAATKCNGPSFC